MTQIIEILHISSHYSLGVDVADQPLHSLVLHRPLTYLLHFSMYFLTYFTLGFLLLQIDIQFNYCKLIAYSEIT